jgi:hypothetical protein
LEIVMSYTSVMVNQPGVHIIDADEVAKHGDPEKFKATTVHQPFGIFSKGMYGEDTQVVSDIGDVLVRNGSPNGLRVPFSFGTSGNFPKELLIDPSNYEGLIKEMEAAGADIRARVLLGTNGKELICKDQDGTNFCWANAPTHGVEVSRLYANDELIYFSPGSVAGPVNGFTNSGGWGGEALKRMVSHGLCPQDIYPPNQVRKPNNFEAAMEIAANYKVIEWWNIENINELVSCLLRGWPVAVGLNWWSHEVLYTNALWMDGTLAIGFRNSWSMSYGDKGFSILQGRKMMPDDACTPRVISPAGRKYNSVGAHPSIDVAA